MADVITSTENLQIEYAFVDGDTRTNNIKDPKADITAQDIEELNTFLRANNALIGDRYQSTFAQINKAKRVTKTTVNYDINN